MELRVENLTKTFKKKKAVANMNFVLHPGIYGLLGPNGSGKTTLLRMIAGVEKQDRGTVWFDGFKTCDYYDIFTSQLGYLPQHFGYYPTYTVEQFWQYLALLKNLSKPYATSRINTLLKQLHLEEQRHVKLKKLSGGMRQRVGIGQALLNEPKLLLLDEPTVGLDPQERLTFYQILHELADDCIIFLSTHIVSDLDMLADEILVMKAGRLMFQDTKEALIASVQGHVWEVEAMPELQSQYALSRVQGQTLRLVSSQCPAPGARLVTPDLNDFYLYYFQKEA